MKEYFILFFLNFVFCIGNIAIGVLIYNPFNIAIGFANFIVMLLLLMES